MEHTTCGEVVPGDLDRDDPTQRLWTGGARVDFGDGESKRCPTCKARTGPGFAPEYPDEWVSIDGDWHAVRIER